MDSKVKRKLDLEDIDVITDEEMTKTFNYVIDYISAKRVGVNGKVEYLVKWEGWDHRQSTWEPEANFASQSIAEIFEAGLKEQMGEGVVAKETPNTSKKSSVKPKKSKFMASKLLEDIRKKQSKSGRKPLPELSAFYDNQLMNRNNNIIQKYEKLIGASKRKSRMSCPLTPSPKKRSDLVLKKDSQRSQRYRLREQLKTTPLKGSSPSTESTGSHEENKNPMRGQSSEGRVDSNAKHNKSQYKTPNNSRKMKVNNDFNKIKANPLVSNSPSKSLPNVSQSLPDTPSKSTAIPDGFQSPIKRFIIKVKARLQSTPDVYTEFLNKIIEFNNKRLELNGLLGNSEELVHGLLNILMFSPQHLHNNRQNGDEECNDVIQRWSQKLEHSLSPEDYTLFWSFLADKDKEDILMSSPDFLWLKIRKLLDDHKDLCKEFEKFMPNLCSKYLKQSNN